MFRIAPLPEKPNLHSENLKIEYRVQNTEYRQDMRKYIYIVVALLCFTACQKEAVQPKVYGRYVPERKDDFAWENEYAAFRMYGPALADENPSNGVDLWLKNSPALAVDTMYARELKDGRPYHINYDGNTDRLLQSGAYSRLRRIGVDDRRGRFCQVVDRRTVFFLGDSGARSGQVLL